MNLQPARRQLARSLTKVPVGQVAVDPNEIGPIEEVEYLASRLELQPLANREHPAKGQVDVHVAFVVIGVAAESAFLSERRSRKCRSREQTIQVLLLPWVAEAGSERGYVRQVVIVSVGIVIAASVADDLTGSVLHRYKARTGVHREGQSALHQPDSAELPVAQQGSFPPLVVFLRRPPRGVQCKLLADVKIGTAALSAQVVVHDHRRGSAGRGPTIQ